MSSHPALNFASAAKTTLAMLIATSTIKTELANMSAPVGCKRKRATLDTEVASHAHSSTCTEHVSGKIPSSAATATVKAHGSAAGHNEQQELRPRSDSYYRNLYRQEVDFREMAIQDPEFKAVLKRNGQLDFTDPKAVMQLTKSSLRLHFGLRMELPDDRLCPPVPNRHNYILWLKDLLDSSSYSPPGDVDKKSLSYAEKNIAANSLSHRIKLVSRPDPATSPLIPLDELGIDAVDFVMTNPPFYESEKELLTLAAQKELPPSTACTGAPVEMVHPAGGEVGFVTRILEESFVLRERVRWYTSMLGKLSSLEALVETLRDRGVTNYAVTEFVQGTKTKRWAVGWSFGGMRAGQTAARGMAQLAWRKVLPAPVEVEIGALDLGKVGEVAGRVDTLMHGLELENWGWDTQELKGVAKTRENVWGRAWRRRKAREKDGGAEGSVARAAESDKSSSGFEVAMAVGRTQAVVVCRWREGHDEAIFQSFCGFLKTRLELVAGDTAKGR
ncbi:hypothetical protein PpBr36_04004 [Pyricularia pennisetigena]|uniref:hypothetical protein n=1 Tax=Pyricularia pennisetigena TaxID=1578925 RepID=UPI001152DE80|nr:hypothetical protein PpBr36_04004 [Pyricularia pennisetigena]TLS27279.1 hypothetical protein PpBr36_04004 [Pyricularia pennisetigena]